MHYYKRHIGDYHTKCGRLSMLEHGAYTLLIDACYDRETFPTEEEAIDWCWARSEDEIAAVRFVLQRFFVEEEGVFIQPRIREELVLFHAKAEKNREIALAREEARRTKRAEASTKRAEASTKRARPEQERTPDEHETPPNHKPLTKNHYILDDPADASATQVAFDELWALYPKRMGGNPKKDAFTAYRARLRAGVDPAAMRAGVIRYAKFIRATGREHTEYVMQAKKFFGPSEHFNEPYSLQVDAARQQEAWI